MTQFYRGTVDVRETEELVGGDLPLFQSAAKH